MAVDTWVERLRQLDTCAVSDAQDKLGIKGTVIGILPLYETERIAGRAVTFKLKTKGNETTTRHLGTSAVEASDPGDIIVCDHRRPDRRGGLGRHPLDGGEDAWRRGRHHRRRVARR